MREDTLLGRIEISPGAIASLASEAVQETYGVVGLANKNLMDGLAELLTRDRSRRGVDIHVDEKGVTVDVYIVVQYGTRISEVAHEAMKRIKFSLEQTLGLPVSAVNVHVQGLRVSEESPGKA